MKFNFKVYITGCVFCACVTAKILGVYLIVVNNTTHSNDFKDDNSDREELLCKPWEFDECFDANAEVQI